MPPESPPEPSSYRITLFYGPEPVDERPDTQACVFNVKKRSWKSGIQVSVEIRAEQLLAIRKMMHLGARLAQALAAVNPVERPAYEERVGDLFAQAVSWCKLDLRLQTGLTQENQRILATELVSDLDKAVTARTEYVVTYILNELDLAPENPSPSSL